MDQLSSCYFCGGALDASLSEYPIIPKSLDPAAENQGTVVLCSTCREKLATIVEPAVEAARADAREAVAASDPSPAESSGPSGDSDTSTDGERAVDGVIEPAEDGSLLGDDGASVAERSRRPAKTDSTPESDPAETASADAPDERAAASAEANAEGSDGDAGENADGAADSPSLTKLEYNKVMRLLQNREMPVDRAEIREVAVNAYDIDGEQFDAIIDAAVDRDLIGQANGQLVESDG
ncbi:hypothetical protein [Haloarcula brevis]|uniref:hypothetical protein n=1 Tax=Haloarcula brevis TaxID=3111453 RepID=UPI00300E8B80